MQRCRRTPGTPSGRACCGSRQPAAQAIDLGLANGPAPLDGQDVAADRLRDLLAQAAEPVAHRLVAALGPVEGASEPRTVARAPSHRLNVPISVQHSRDSRVWPVSTMSPRPGWISRGSTRTRADSPELGKLRSVHCLAGKGCAVADLCECSFTISNPVSPTNSFR